jgi:hypothetical protein
MTLKVNDHVVYVSVRGVVDSIYTHHTTGETWVGIRLENGNYKRLPMNHPKLRKDS